MTDRTSDPSAGTILAVDDEPDNLNVLEGILAPKGYRVALFPRGDLAIEAAREEPPDLILLDILMPGMDGYEVCQKLKADVLLGGIPVIFLSALSSAESVVKGFEAGGSDYIGKPFREPELLARVKTQLSLRNAYKDLDIQHERLKRLEEHRDTLVHMLAHDMRTPLQGMLGNLQLAEMEETTHPDSRALGCIRKSIECVRTLARMVSTMVDVSRMESVTIPLSIHRASVRDLLEEVLSQSCSPSQLERIHTHVQPGCPDLDCDWGLTVRILDNLLANAFKYADEGTVAVGACADPAGVRIWVADQGRGIDPALQGKLFQKFSVLHDESMRRMAASGLGLAFCRMATEAQGGSIGVQSQPGEGSTFWLTLPAYRE